MPKRYQSYGQPANVAVWRRENLRRKEQVQDCDDPVCDHNEESEHARFCHKPYSQFYSQAQPDALPLIRSHALKTQVGADYYIA
jgi:hypothetical protein